MVDTMVDRCSMGSMVGHDVSMNIRDSLSQCRSLDAKGHDATGRSGRVTHTTMWSLEGKTTEIVLGNK